MRSCSEIIVRAPCSESLVACEASWFKYELVNKEVVKNDSVAETIKNTMIFEATGEEDKEDLLSKMVAVAATAAAATAAAMGCRCCC